MAARSDRTSAKSNAKSKKTVAKKAPLKRVPRPAPAPPPPPAEKPKTIEERMAIADERLGKMSDEFRRVYIERLDMSWIYHDAALEGVVYTEQELRSAIDPGTPVLPDSTLQPICDDIRRHREAIAFIRDYAQKKRQPVTTDVVKKIYLILHPEEGDIKAVKYRKEVPQHRLYFHEYAPPDKIAHKVRQIVDWVNDPETRKARSPMRIAARAHFDLLRAFPFPHDSGKVARLFMNLLLLRNGYPAAIIHSAERQRYYEALKSSAITINSMVQDSIEYALASVEKLLDENSSRTRSFY